MFPCQLERNRESQWFGRRKALINAIEERINSEEISELASIDYFEERRGDKSLDSLQKKLIAEEKAKRIALEALEA